MRLHFDSVLQSGSSLSCNRRLRGGLGEPRREDGDAACRWGGWCPSVGSWNPVHRAERRPGVMASSQEPKQGTAEEDKEDTPWRWEEMIITMFLFQECSEGFQR